MGAFKQRQIELSIYTHIEPIDISVLVRRDCWIRMRPFYNPERASCLIPNHSYIHTLKPDQQLQFTIMKDFIANLHILGISS
jgi:hypothetical protein